MVTIPAFASTAIRDGEQTIFAAFTPVASAAVAMASTQLALWAVVREAMPAPPVAAVLVTAILTGVYALGDAIK